MDGIYIKTVDEGGYYVAQFAEVLAKVAESKWLTAENFNEYYNIAYNNYKNDTKPSKSFQNCGNYNFTFNNGNAFGNISFANYVSAKLTTYQKYKSTVEYIK